MDHWCSGKQSCQVEIGDFVKLTDACPREVVGYLRARYICLRGMKGIDHLGIWYLFVKIICMCILTVWINCNVSVLNPIEQCCRSPGISINVTDHDGYIAAGNTRCGEINCPLLLNAMVGQQFNIWAYYFNTSSPGRCGILRCWHRFDAK